MRGKPAKVFAVSNILRQAGGFTDTETIDPNRKELVTYGTQTEPVEFYDATRVVNTSEGTERRQPELNIETIESDFHKIGGKAEGDGQDQENNDNISNTNKTINNITN